MDSEAVRWCFSVAGKRIHGTTRQRPLEHFECEEKPCLRPLPRERWEPATWQTAKIGMDCHGSVARSFYSVPFKYAGLLPGTHRRWVLGGGHADGTWETRLRKYILADLLVLDDFGMKELSPQQAEDLYELICERYRGGSMVVVSNRAPKDWCALFPNPVFAEGAPDRLAGTHRRWVSAHQVFMPGKSYRPVHRPGQDTVLPAQETAATEGTSQGVSRAHNRG